MKNLSSNFLPNQNFPSPWNHPRLGRPKKKNKALHSYTSKLAMVGNQPLHSWALLQAVFDEKDCKMAHLNLKHYSTFWIVVGIIVGV